MVTNPCGPGFAVGRIVEKVGRTTGSTLGIINLPESYLNHAGTPHEQWTMEQVVVGMEDVFSAYGDSGALVIDRRMGVAMGMIWGGVTSREATFVTPIKDIIDDIFLITGLSASL